MALSRDQSAGAGSPAKSSEWRQIGDIAGSLISSLGIRAPATEKTSKTRECNRGSRG